MSKVALLQAAKNRAIQEAEKTETARRNSKENIATTPVTVAVASAPIPIPAPKAIPKVGHTPSPNPSSPQIQQVIIYPQDNSALIKERVEKEKAQELYQVEKLARARSHERHQQEVERIKQTTSEQLQAEHQARIKAEELQRQEAERIQQLARDDDSLKQKHTLALEKNIQLISKERDSFAKENELLKQELERLKKMQEETSAPVDTIAKEEENKGEIAASMPPPYEVHQETDVVSLSPINNVPYNDVSLSGDIAPESPAEDGSGDKCVVS